MKRLGIFSRLEKKSQYSVYGLETRAKRKNLLRDAIDYTKNGTKLIAAQCGGGQLVIDTQKIEAARRGDKESFAQVYEMIAPDLYKVALYTLGNAHDAEDAVSETFIEAYKGITKLRNVSSFKPWMMKILSIRCKRKIADYVKGKNVYDIDSFITTLPVEGDVSADVSEQITVMEAMGRLNPQERLIVTLSILQGYTTKDIATIIGSPQGTVSSKMHRTLAKLRKMLEVNDQPSPRR